MSKYVVAAIVAIVLIIGGIYAFTQERETAQETTSVQEPENGVLEIPENETGITTGTIEPHEDEICPAVCVPMWRLDPIANECTFTECGSGCGPDQIMTFPTQINCELNIEQ